MFTPEGRANPTPRKYVYAARDRMDETYDRIRSVRDERYLYIRNFEPNLPYAQRVQYGELMPTMRVWREWNAEGKLKGPQTLFFRPTKPDEEFYETQSDPHQIHDLAKSTDPMHVEKMKELRAALDSWLKETNDLGAVPERELIKRGIVRDVLGNYKDRKLPAGE